MVTTFLNDVYKSFVTNVLDVSARLLSLLFFFLLLTLPIIYRDENLLAVLGTAFIFAIFAASWDLLVGRTGQISLGHALFFGTGAYTTAILYNLFDLQPWLTIPMGVVVAVLAALFIGYPCLKVRGPYLALVTMALPLIASGLLFVFAAMTKGEEGVTAPTFFLGLDVQDRVVAEYYFALLVLLVTGVLMYKIANSRMGIVFISILDDELGSKACGINVTKYKLLGFAISAAFASLAGSVYAHIHFRAGLASLSLTYSFYPLMMTVLGGIGTIYGAIAGALIMRTVDRYVLTIPKLSILGTRILPLSDYLHPLIFIVVVVVFILKWPRGIARFVTDKLTDLSEERELEERGKRIWKTYKKK